MFNSLIDRLKLHKMDLHISADPHRNKVDVIVSRRLDEGRQEHVRREISDDKRSRAVQPDVILDHEISTAIRELNIKIANRAIEEETRNHPVCGYPVHA